MEQREMEKGSPKRGGFWRALRRTFCFVLATLVILLGGAFGVVYLLSRGPSEAARNLFVMSVRETSAVGFLANIFLSEDEIYAIENSGKTEVGANSVDTSLITVKAKENTADADENASESAQEENIEIIDVVGATFTGKLMIVHDPTCVTVGVSSDLGHSGDTLINIVNASGAIGAINGGGFYDPNGTGNGGTPDGVVIYDGKLLYGENTVADTAVIDYDGILHVGSMNGKQALELGARWAVSFGPVLVVNGEKCDGLSGGLNPRSAIGQRADGAILLLVINGRQIDSFGATHEDVADVMLSYGAVNALNLDGGSSSSMLYRGEYQTISASVIGDRPIPTAVLVFEEGTLE